MVYFENSALKIIRANDLLFELQYRVNNLHDNLRADYHECDDGTGDCIVVIDHGDTSIFPLICGDIIHNIRSSLDFLIYDVARMHGISPKRMHFPVAKDKSKFDEIFTKDEKQYAFLKLPAHVIQVIKDIEPYSGGYPLIYNVHELDNWDKHNAILLGIEYFSAMPNTGDVVRGLTTELSGFDPGPILVLGEMPSPIKNGDRISPLGGLTPAQRLPLNNIQFQINIVGDFTCSGRPLFPLLQDAIIWIGRLVHRFSTTFQQERHLNQIKGFRDIIRI